MKKIIFLTFLCAVFLYGNPAWSLTIVSGDILNGTEVGSEDTYLFSEDVENSEAAEEAWIEDYLQEDIIFTKYDPELVYLTNDNNVWALQLEYQPDYFYVKVGGGNSISTHHLFENDNESFDWGVFNTGYLTYTGRDLEIGFVSHGGGAGAAPVPEPGTIVLMGLGLIGLAGVGRKKLKL